MTEEDFKKLLEETYKEWDTEETDDYGDSLKFDEFIKRIRNGNWKDAWLYRIISPSRIP